jgi:putative flippase GtrA
VGRIARRYPRFLTYLIIGASAAVVDLLVFLALFNLAGLGAVMANVISVSVATIQSYALNAAYNFKTSDRTLLRFSSFAAVSTLGLAVGSYLIWLLHDQMAIDGNLSKVGVMPVIVVLQYVLNKHVSFRK